ncbi:MULTISPECIES: two-component system sensor histidine kinase PmrB [Enterobacteriaceae]|uniref:histidine kinase n=1 Tax=Kluyvera genomosp. 2 TaxID=2774054 RepID=A0A2T2Y6J0_9ENTR|nr:MULTISPECIES: two-component system sensor histidine kinase PmrB [Enterobacteriaceae]HAT3917460.1 two-component system sensor histidine kinase PmrB [Kluyvera ascorbata]PSR48154.1 two-component system sensor histidine kinase BasS [Kluyvera genomosp. 2]BBQ84748.1 two-component sensor histidine kinase [Klebsiella sp. WP3-W18-ESBL-02]BBR21798.1 two-component sensor histidine kinase [Klebsiella sp. WP3-S18-ESBL-05]BBR58091.1 two-component sensor histidine kinase [Klebsiella sp. WP4-W18-ESBL-05]
MALFSVRKWPMRHQLLLAIGLILVVFQLISVFWLWHESKEQIELEVAMLMHNHNNVKHIRHEVREAIASLLVPSVVIIGLALYLCLQAVKRITQPLADLQRELDARTPGNLQPIFLQQTTVEVEAVTHAINQLVENLTQTLDRERLFTADVAHELRTPLAGLKLHLELLEKTQHLNLAPLLQRLDQMTESVAQLLLLARVGQSFSAGSYQQVNLLSDVIEPLKGELETMLASREQTLAIAEPVPTVTVAGDATLLRLLLRNLIENAHRYSPPSSTITVSLARDSKPMLIVEDEGPGIDESKVGELSQAFVRMDSRYGGIGLGLSIVTRIAQLHEAAFFLQNRETGTGTRAWVEFQLTRR